MKRIDLGLTVSNTWGPRSESLRMTSVAAGRGSDESFVRCIGNRVCFAASEALPGDINTNRTNRRLAGGTTVAVKFLSQEWAETMTSALNSSDDFKSAASGKSAKLQQVVTDVEGAEVKYYFVLDNGTANVSLGEVEEPEATVTQNYDTAAGLQKGEVNAQQAFMQGKLKVSGNMMKLMQLQGVISAMPKAVGDVEVEY